MLNVFVKETEAKGSNMEDFYETNRNESSKYRKCMAPNLSLQGPNCDPKWLQNGALGHQNEAQMTPKWSLGGPQNRMRQKIPKGRLGHDFGVAFWSHVWSKIDAKNEPKKR